MSLLIPSPRFLLDENVHSGLFRFLKLQGFDVKLASRSATDSQLISISKKEKRVLVTNDEDFCHYQKDEVFSVIWLRIPQNDPGALISSFKKLLSEFKDFWGRLVVLSVGGWRDYPLGEREL